jgi:hypothetical protein
MAQLLKLMLASVDTDVAQEIYTYQITMYAHASDALLLERLCPVTFKDSHQPNCI